MGKGARLEEYHRLVLDRGEFAQMIFRMLGGQKVATSFAKLTGGNTEIGKNRS